MADTFDLVSLMGWLLPCFGFFRSSSFLRRGNFCFSKLGSYGSLLPLTYFLAKQQFSLSMLGFLLRHE